MNFKRNFIVISELLDTALRLFINSQWGVCETRRGEDSFYRGLTTEEAQRVHEYNFDHPDAFDSEQLVECIEKLKSVQSVQVPIYDFKNHHRCADNFQ
ncbi:hypothetical protein CsSME_00034140 [Camellia sinensis var. sinensis]